MLWSTAVVQRAALHAGGSSEVAGDAPQRCCAHRTSCSQTPGRRPPTCRPADCCRRCHLAGCCRRCHPADPCVAAASRLSGDKAQRVCVSNTCCGADDFENSVAAKDSDPAQRLSGRAETGGRRRPSRTLLPVCTAAEQRRQSQQTFNTDYTATNVQSHTSPASTITKAVKPFRCCLTRCRDRAHITAAYSALKAVHCATIRLLSAQMALCCSVLHLCHSIELTKAKCGAQATAAQDVRLCCCCKNGTKWSVLRLEAGGSALAGEAVVIARNPAHPKPYPVPSDEHASLASDTIPVYAILVRLSSRHRHHCHSICMDCAACWRLR